MVELSPRKLIKMGKNSYGIVIPKEIALEYLNNGKEKAWVAILEHREAPSGEDIIKWLKK